MRISTTQQAWSNIVAQYSLNSHKHRRPEIEFDGTKFVITQRPPSAKGFVNFIIHFMFNPNPSIPSHSYSTVKPYPILPQSFVDCRDWQLAEYNDIGYPGHKLSGEVLIAARRFGPEATYTNWSNGEPSLPRNVSINPNLDLDLLITAETIVDYWHISANNRLPIGQKEKFSALINALGLGYLYHPLLPIPTNPGFGFTSDPPPANYPPQPIFTRPGLTMNNPRIKHRTPIKICSFCRHKPTTHYLVIGDIKQRTCEACIDKNTWFLPEGSWSLEPIADSAPEVITCKMCPNPATKLHNNFTPLCDSCVEYVLVHTINAIITPLTSDQSTPSL